MKIDKRVSAVNFFLAEALPPPAVKQKSTREGTAPSVCFLSVICGQSLFIRLYSLGDIPVSSLNLARNAFESENPT